MENWKKTTIEERKLVIKLSNEVIKLLLLNCQLSLRNILKVVIRSVNCIQKLLQKFKKTGILANNEGRGRKKIMNSITERRVIHQVKIDPKISAPKIAASTSNTLGRFVSAEMPQQFWNEVIFSDESKLNVFGSDCRRMVWRKPNTSHHPKHTIPTVEHGGGSVVGKLVFTDGIMHKMAYLNILQNNLKESADKLGHWGRISYSNKTMTPSTLRLFQIEAHEIHRGRVLEVRLSLALSTIQVTVGFSSAKFHEETIDGDTTYLRLHNFRMETEVERNILPSPCARYSTHRTTDPLI
ncbi:transposable element Tcb2 transposase [Trichonephila clavipes]|nr:transposable element Tcb2 transposase [Trichonephila clavipes]